jgi:hypothetical protein
LDKITVADYRSLQTRFKNDELAVYTRAHSMLYGKESPFNEIDSAILWMRSEISEGVEKATHRGSASANLQEVSSWVIRVTGIIGEPLTADELTSQVAQVQKMIDAEFMRIVNLYRNELAKSCSVLQNCTDCQIAKEDQDSALLEVALAMKKKLRTDAKFRDDKVQRSIVEKAKKKKVETILDLSSAHQAKKKEAALDLTPPPGTGSVLAPDSKLLSESEKNVYRFGFFNFKDAFVPKTETKSVITPQRAVATDSLARSPDAKALHLDRIDSLPFDQERRGDPVKHGPCDVSLLLTRKKGAKGNEVHVKFTAKNAKTKGQAEGTYYFLEPINGLVKDVWYPLQAKTPELDQACPDAK